MSQIFIRVEVVGDDCLPEGTVTDKILAAINQSGTIVSKEYRKTSIVQFLEVFLTVPALSEVRESSPSERREDDGPADI
jgi:hypothetical protein